MTIQILAQKQTNQSATIYFARRKTSNCYWFNLGAVVSYSDSDMNGRRVYLTISDLAATDWYVIKTSKK